MSRESKDGVRVIRKHKKGHSGHHLGAWKVAYADFVTAMMAFFLVMWIVGLNTSIKEAVAAYFKDPVGFMEATERGDKPINLTTPGIMARPDVQPNTGKDSYELEKRLNEERKRFERAKSSLKKIIARCPDFKKIADSIQIRIANEGLRIDLVESRSDLFFDSGSAIPKPRTKQLLRQIALELGQLPNKVIIEGHTDSRPYCGPNGWTNWELSTARGNAARAITEGGGLKKGQMVEVRGLADTMPLDPEHKDSFKNRRVSILLPFREAQVQRLQPVTPKD
jgi:chemotaxis protein MotB